MLDRGVGVSVPETFECYIAQMITEKAQAHGHELALVVEFNPNVVDDAEKPVTVAQYTLFGNLDKGPQTTRMINAALGSLFRENWIESREISREVHEGKKGIVYQCAIKGDPHRLIADVILERDENAQTRLAAARDLAELNKSPSLGR